MPSQQAAAQKVIRSRERMRGAGLRPVQFWVPDTRLPALAQELQRQCMQLRADAAETEVLHFAEAAAGKIEGWV